MSTHPQVWLITGTNAGFGLELALLALLHGHTVVATARHASKYPQALKDAGADLVSIDMATTTDAELKALVDDTVARHGQLDVLVNNAGYIEGGAVEAVTDAASHRQLDVNFFAPLRLVRAALPHMRKRRAGVIVNVSSIAGAMGGAGYGLYSASKFALEGMSESLAEEVKSLGVRVHVVEPGYFRTSLLSGFGKGAGEKVEGYMDIDGVLGGVHDNQPGDPKKGMQRVYEVVSGTGMGKGKEWVLRIPLGTDAYGVLGAKYKQLAEDLESMKEIASSTDL